MGKILRITIVAFCLFAAGLIARAVLETKPDRAHIALQLFQSHCIALLKGEIEPPARGFVPLNTPGPFSWGHPETALMLSISPQRCGVSDILDLFTQAEHDTLVTGVETFVQEQFPEFKANDIFMDWAVFKQWESGPEFQVVNGERQRNPNRIVLAINQLEKTRAAIHPDSVAKHTTELWVGLERAPFTDKEFKTRLFKH